MSNPAKETIFIVSNSFQPATGGVQTHLTDFSGFLALEGHGVVILTLKPNGIEAKFREKTGNILVFRVPVPGLEYLPLMRLRFLYENVVLFLGALILLLTKLRNAVIVNGHGYAFFLKPLKLIFPDKRFVLTTHNLYHCEQHGKLRNAIVRSVFSGVDFILAVSDQSKKELIELGIAASKISVFNQWVDQDSFKPMDKSKAKQETGFSNKFTALFVGRFVPEKGAGLLLQVADSLPNIYFVFIGDGPMAETIKSECAKRKNAVYIGKILNTRLPLYLNAADVVLVPSLWEDPRPRVLLEALSCGTPVMATKRGGIPETLTNGSGILIDPPGREGFVKELSVLYENPERLAKLSRNAVTHVKTNYSCANATIILRHLIGKVQ